MTEKIFYKRKTSIGGDTKALEALKRKQIKEYHKFSEAMDIRAKDNRLRVVSGSSNLNKTKVKQWINEQYKGYTATIPRTWQQKINDRETALAKVNPKYVKCPRGYDKSEIKYNTNCVNSVIAYEMRSRGYNVIAGKSNSKLRENPLIAWENAERIDIKENALMEIINAMKIWGSGARACVCLKNSFTGMGHAIAVENINGTIEFLDVQLGINYNKSEIDLVRNDTIWYFRMDNTVISTRGINGCEKE